jgi:hypothetical protein
MDESGEKPFTAAEVNLQGEEDVKLGSEGPAANSNVSEYVSSLENVTYHEHQPCDATSGMG